MIDRATVDRIIDAARIVDVVGEFVTLRKSGVNYKGLCPFHDDKNPSFMVSPAKNICHCFVCGKGGTPAGFLMEHEQISYPEALRWLAKKYNIEIVEKELTDEERQEQSERESMFVVNEWAMKYFNDVLKNDPDGIAIGKQYFRSRGIRDDIIEKFQLGFSLPKRDAFATAALKAGYKAEFLVKTGLCFEPTPSPSQKGGEAGNEHPSRLGGTGGGAGLTDRYRGRVIFPWLNVSGKVVAFGSRLLDSRTKGVAQKYVNSPESDIYHKERELYGIYQAKRAIVKEDRVFMVEGYTDVIAMHQAGIENVVANSGTALSTHQVRLLHRFTANITLLYDGDEAGIHAAMRGTDMLLAEDMNVKVLLLPDGDDPDSFARKHSSQELRDYIENNQTDFIVFKSRQLLDHETDPIKRSEAVSSIVRSISVIPRQLVRDAYIAECAQRLQVSEATLISTMNKYIDRDLEDRRKEQERAKAREANTAQNAVQPTGEGSAVQPQPERNEGETIIPIGLHPAEEQAREVEELLIREIVRHGEEIIFDNIETDDGQTISLSVAQYIDFDLAQDNIRFSSPIYNQILSEAVARQEVPGFKAESYFCSHPDLEISQLATRLAIDRHQLGGRFVLKTTLEQLRSRIIHLVMDYRLDIVETHLKDIQQQLRQTGLGIEHVMKLMQEYKETQQLRNAIARKLGSELIA